MIRLLALTLAVAACGRSQGVADQDLPGLVVEAKQAEPAIDVERAAREPAELGRALARPYRAVLAALGPHTVAVNTTNTVEEAGKAVSELTDHAQIENGARGAYHAVYTNSADYGRETTFVDGKLYLRPRYQRWHGRAPETPDEPAALRDQYFDAVAATWDLLAPGIELTDRGAVEVSGRPGRKLEIQRAPTPTRPAAEALAQRKWREGRTVEAVGGEVVIDREKGVPLAVKLTGTVGFSRDGRRFVMKLSVDAAVSGVGTVAAIAAPAEGEVVATPERLREVDDRDYLLQGIAPPLRKNTDGTARAPRVPDAPAARPPDQAEKAPDKPDKPKRKRKATDEGARP
jgi:hypothetical protein